jgi:hypothetical protein
MVRQGKGGNLRLIVARRRVATASLENMVEKMKVKSHRRPEKSGKLKFF